MVEWFLAGILKEGDAILAIAFCTYERHTELAPNLEADSLLKDIVIARKETSQLW